MFRDLGRRISKIFFSRDYFLLWLGQSVSQIGDGAGFIAVMWWVQSTTGSAMALGTLAMAKGLVATLLGPFAGVLIDRLDRKKIIVATDVVRGLVYCTLGYLAWTDSLTIGVLIVLSCIAAACAQFMFPAVAAVVPLLVPDKGLEKANALNTVTRQMVGVAGYSVGGILVALFGVPALLFLNGVSFLCSAASEMLIHIPPIQNEGEPLSVKLFVSDLREAVDYILGFKVLMRVIMVAMVLNFFVAPFFVLLPMFVDVHMGAGSDVYGYLLAASMAGGVVGTVLLSTTRLVQDNLWLVKWGIVLQAVLFLTLPFLPVQLWMSHVVMLFIAGCLNLVVNIYFQTLLQRATRQDHMGKVFSLVGTATGALQPAASGVAGAAASVFSLPAILTVGFSVSLLAGVQFARIPGIDDWISSSSRSEPVAPVVTSVD